MSEIIINLLAFTYLLECTLKQDLTQKPLHRYRRVLAFLRMPKVLQMYGIGVKRQTMTQWGAPNISTARYSDH